MNATSATARVQSVEVAVVSPGSNGFDATNEHGAAVRIPPEGPTLRATVVYEWQGTPPTEILDLLNRAENGK
jgi:hypothetical protein